MSDLATWKYLVAPASSPTSLWATWHLHAETGWPGNPDTHIVSPHSFLGDLSPQPSAMLSTPQTGLHLVGILQPCWTSLATITSRKLSTALRNPALSGTQTSRSSGDSGWNTKTSAKVSDMLVSKFYSLCKSWLPRYIHRTKNRESVGEGLIQICLDVLAHPLNCQGLVAKTRCQNGSIWGNFICRRGSKLYDH